MLIPPDCTTILQFLSATTKRRFRVNISPKVVATGDGGYGIADEPWRILREEGEDAFWAEMMRWYEEWLVKTEEKMT